MNDDTLYIQDFGLRQVRSMDELRQGPGGLRNNGLVYAMPGPPGFAYRLRVLKPSTNANELKKLCDKGLLWLVVHGDKSNKILMEL